MSNLMMANKLKVERNEDFSTKIYFDFPNQRLKVLNYDAGDYSKLVHYLLDKAVQAECGKIIMVCSEKDWKEFLTRGFIMEGIAEGYLKGETGYFMSYFMKRSRQNSSVYEEEQQILVDILALEATVDGDIPTEFQLRTASKDDIPKLISLFKQIFETYPVPVTDEDYLEKTMEEKSLFKVAEYKGRIISAASAEVNKELGNAEITDCATLPEFRGKNLMSFLIKSLEKEMNKLEVYSLYSLARAASKGIGKVFHKQGYKFRGRLINNCNICGNFEDMNLWVKYNQPHS